MMGQQTKVHTTDAEYANVTVENSCSPHSRPHPVHFFSSIVAIAEYLRSEDLRHSLRHFMYMSAAG